MAFTIYNFEDNNDVSVLAQAGPFKVIQWDRDLSVSPGSAATAWFSAQMDVRRRTGVTLQAGAMQWTAGSVRASTGVKGAGDLMGKMLRGAVSQDSMIKLEYVGVGKLVCEPTWQHLLLVDLAKWGNSVVLNDGLFLACDSSIKHSLQRRSNLSSAVACPEVEVVYVDLHGDELRVDGNHALVWTSGLEFTVERSGKSLIGSAASGEGLVNVYRGTGRVMMAPMQAATYYNAYAPDATS